MEYGRIVLLCRQRPHGGRRRSREAKSSRLLEGDLSLKNTLD